MAKGSLTFLTEENSAKLKDSIPKEIWEEKQRELEAHREKLKGLPTSPVEQIAQDIVDAAKKEKANATRDTEPPAA